MSLVVWRVVIDEVRLRPDRFLLCNLPILEELLLIVVGQIGIEFKLRGWPQDVLEMLG